MQPSELLSAEYIKSKSDKIVMENSTKKLYTLYHEINEILSTASDNGKYSIVLPKNIVMKYENNIISTALEELKKVGYKVERKVSETTYLGMPMDENIQIKWD